MRESELYNINLYSDLRCALNGNEFYLVLQPIVSIETGDCIEAECLIRWESPKQGFIPPDKFIPLAEKTGFILPLGKWIIEKACEELKILISRGVSESFKLHINISALQLVQPDFSIHLLDTVRKNGLRNENICIELTETVLLSEVKHTCEILNALRNYGISVAIDDFGSGFSSLSYLHMLPFDSIKIDRSFISSVLKDDNSEAVISAVVVLARGFNVPLVAEGIEDNAVRVRLIELGVEKAQGYYFCRPSRFEFFKCNDGKLDYSVETATLK
jgi:EAL domain-containing protein (putative c-di-GMP-specific phosphodiesterase class I)